MSNKYSGIENLLGLPEGSTIKSEDELRPILANGVKNKTKELVDKTNRMEVLDTMSSPELVKNGFDIEELERDKVRIKREAFDVYDIAKALLDNFKDQLEGQVNPNDRMWAAGAKMIDSVTGSLDKLTNMILKFKQEEEMKGIALISEEENTSKTMSPQDWIAFVKEVKDDDSVLDQLPDKTDNGTDQEIIEQDP